jgi:hypothetical protein
MSSAGDGLRFFDLARLKPLGGWRTNSIAEITSLLHEGENYFLFGDNSYLYVLREETMLERAEGTFYLMQADWDWATSSSFTTET